MANRTLRRNQPGTSIVTIGSTDESTSHVISVQRESRTESDIDRSADSDDNDADGQPDRSQPIGVAEVNPGELGNFIAERARNRDGNGDGERTRRKRADSGVKRGKRKSKEESKNLASLFVFADTWANILLKSEELTLTDDEREKMVEALNEFERFHDIPMVNSKTMSEIGLGVAALTVYGPRIVALVMNKKRKRQAVGNVTPITQTGSVRH
jgi:hypothetical protein